MTRVYTIGHSNRTLAAFIGLLAGAGIDLLADIRTKPASRFNPHFNGKALAASLAEVGIGYRHIPALGGLRPACDEPSPNTYWQVGAFRNYADYAMTSGFREGLDQLLTLARDHTVAIMCAEADWHRCHRQIVTDYLLAAEVEVHHILANGVEEAAMHDAARVEPDGRIVYPAAQNELL